MLRYKADRKTLIYMAVTTAVPIVHWQLPEFNPFLFAMSLIMAIPVAVIAHNHNHVRTWKSKTLNVLQDYWITLFYGFPAFAWIPTHNKNHHKHNNRADDHTRTYRITEKNNLFTLLSYPTISGYFQQKPIGEFLKIMWEKVPKRFFFYVSQYVLVGIFVGTLLWIDWKKAVLFFIIPQQFALFSILAINYLQHIHADEQSDLNHSRNFVGSVLNWYLLNNGYHTVHHETPGLHWSELPEAHAEVEDQIDDRLNVENFWWFMLKTYILSPIIPSMGTDNMRKERMEQDDTTPRPAE